MADVNVIVFADYFLFFLQLCNFCFYFLYQKNENSSGLCKGTFVLILDASLQKRIVLLPEMQLNFFAYSKVEFAESDILVMICNIQIFSI